MGFHIQRKIPEWHRAERESSRHGSTELRRAWNVNNVFCFSCLGNLGHPFHHLSPFIQRQLHVWWHHKELQIITQQHWLTNHTVHVSTTTQPYSSLILWTGTTRVGNVKTEQEEGRRTAKMGEKERKIIKWNTPSPTLTFVMDAYTTTPSTITTDILTVF